ncbi:MAG: hypothetical protein QXP34_01715 [Candidatus Aenigmatarchaeota archaeon]
MNSKEILSEVLHIYNVSLKNNKGLETVKQLIKTLCSFYDSLITEYLQYLKNKGKIKEIPEVPMKRLEIFEENFTNEEVKPILENYKILRFCINSEIMIKDEYRRSMIIICKSLDKVVEINQKSLKDFVEMAKKFLQIVEKQIG